MAAANVGINEARAVCVAERRPAAQSVLVIDSVSRRTRDRLPAQTDSLLNALAVRDHGRFNVGCRPADAVVVGHKIIVLVKSADSVGLTSARPDLFVCEEASRSGAEACPAAARVSEINSVFCDTLYCVPAYGNAVVSVLQALNLRSVELIYHAPADRVIAAARLSVSAERAYRVGFGSAQRNSGVGIGKLIGVLHSLPLTGAVAVVKPVTVCSVNRVPFELDAAFDALGGNDFRRGQLVRGNQNSAFVFADLNRELRFYSV